MCVFILTYYDAMNIISISQLDSSFLLSLKAYFLDKRLWQEISLNTKEIFINW